MEPRFWKASLVVLLPVLAATSLVAQSNSEINSGLQFNFSPPGARSLSLGSAFVGLADDATAAYTNPAGLTSLSRPEFSVEGRRFQYMTEYLYGGSDPTNCTPDRADTCAGLDYREATTIANDFSFGSFVYPIGNLSLAVYFHTLLDFRQSEQTAGAFFNDPAVSGGRSRLFPTQGSVSVRIISYGGS